MCFSINFEINCTLIWAFKIKLQSVNGCQKEKTKYADLCRHYSRNTEQKYWKTMTSEVVCLYQGSWVAECVFFFINCQNTSVLVHTVTWVSLCCLCACKWDWSYCWNARVRVHSTQCNRSKSVLSMFVKVRLEFQLVECLWCVFSFLRF